MPARDPLAVGYDGQTEAFLDALQTGALTVSGLYHPKGFISNSGIVSAPVIIETPPGSDWEPYAEAFHRSMRYVFRLRTYPAGATGKPLREKKIDADGKPFWSYVRGPWWCVVEIQGPDPRLWRVGGVRAVVRIGPQGVTLGTSPAFTSPV